MHHMLVASLMANSGAENLFDVPIYDRVFFLQIYAYFIFRSSLVFGIGMMQDLKPTLRMLVDWLLRAGH